MRSKVWYIVMTLCCINLYAIAQSPYASKLGRFQVTEIKGCAPLTVTLSMRPGFACDGANPCDMDFGDGSQGNLTFTHTYTQPGTFTLRVFIQSLDPVDDITITVLPNTPPQFDVFACANNEVSVIIPDMTYDQYIINFNDSSPTVPVLKGNTARANHVYATAGNKTVTVRGVLNNAANNCNPGTKPITAVATLPAPTITLLQVLDNASLQLNVSTQPGIQYRLEIGQNSGTTFQLLRTVFNVSTETVTNLRTDDNYYCFRLGAFDPCNGTTVYSNVICSSNVDLTITNNVINVNWVTYTTGVSNFRIGKTWAGGGQTVTDNATPYPDTEIICGTEYCYRVTTNYPNGSQSISLEKCGVAISTDVPAAIENISSIVEDPGVSLQWFPSTGFTPSEYSVYKSVNGVAMGLLGNTATQDFSDATYTTESSACYKISFVDVCGNESPFSEEACPVRLAGTLETNNTFTLSWTAYNGYKDGVTEYVIEKFSQDGQLLQTFNPGTSLTFFDPTEDLNDQIVIYQVTAIPVASGITESISNRLVVTKSPNLFHPSAFTPNGDNLNDVFDVYGQFITDFEMNIFNRWGELLFTTNTLGQGWDGSYKGNTMPEGTYTFVAKITDHIGRTFKKSGTVVLLRKQK
jgi:gliding motility-associated-like protein